MAELTNQIIDSWAHFPQGIDHPIAAAVSLVVAGTVGFVERGVHNRTAETYGVQFPNQALLEESVTPDLKKVNRERLAPAVLVTAGLGLVALQVLGHPTYESTTPNRDANVMVVQDASLSMLNTKDLGNPDLTRLAAVNSALQASSYAGKLGIVQSGANFKTTAPLGSDRKTLVQAEKPQVDPNGGNLVGAIDSAVSLLPIKNGKHEGSLVVISDGTIDQSSQDIAVVANALKQAGVTIKVVVPGTTQGKYQLGANRQQIPSGASADVFAVFGSKNIIEAKDASTINTTIKETLVDAGTSHQNHTWYPPGVLGALLLGGGIVLDKRQRATRII